MGTTLCIGDLHLDAQRPAMVDTFERFLRTWSGRVDRLYILGDLFEYWIGDDHSDQVSKAVAEALRRFASAGSEVLGSATTSNGCSIECWPTVNRAR